MKYTPTARHVGVPHAEVRMSIRAERVHPSLSGWQEADAEVMHHLQHFNGLPTRQWVDIPGGDVCVEDFANIHVRLWCHSGDWKSGLAWDYVKLVNVNQPVAVEPSVQHEAEPVVHSAHRMVDSLRDAYNLCTQQ